MGQVRFHKVVSALPSPLEKDGLYLVRTGEGFDLYASDSTGAIAHKVNTGASVQDTGWRNVTALLQLPSEFGGTGVYVRRVGNFCYMQIQPPYSPKQARRVLSRRVLPTGFRPRIDGVISLYGLLGAGALLIGFYEVNTSGYVISTVSSAHSGNTSTSGVLTYIARDPFPSELPGTGF